MARLRTCFLDVTSEWDASLLLLLDGAVGVTIVAFRFILKRSAPLLEYGFVLPTLQHVDGPLVVGAVLFGIAWGISGYCPGPGIVLLAAPNWEAWIFIPAVVIGAFVNRVSRLSPVPEQIPRTFGQ